MCSLINEVVWVRLLKLTLGNTVYASGIVVSVFLGGLALGSFISARLSDRIRAPIRLYAWLELVIAASALAVPFVLRYADRLYRVIYRSSVTGPACVLCAQVVISAAVLLVPTLVMGSTLPLLAAATASGEERRSLGRSAGMLYAMNTLGAAVGCFLAGFVLIRAFGVMGALYAAAFLNLVVAICALVLSRRAGPRPDEIRADGVEAVPPRPETLRWPRMLLVACLVAGFASIAYELIWIRSIINFVGTTTYVFSAVLTIYLVGIMLGAGLAGLLVGRGVRPAPALACVLLLLGLCGILYVPLLSAGAALHDGAIAPLTRLLNTVTHTSWYSVYPLMASFVFFLAPSVLLGMCFPLALETWHAGGAMAGRSTGSVYGVNTLGCVGGGLAAAFVLIPQLGIQQSMLFLGMLTAWAGALLLLACPGKIRMLSPVLVLLALVAAALVPADLFRDCLFDKLKTQYGAEELLHVDEGVTTTLSIHREPGGSLHMCASGMHIAGDETGQSAWQKFHGHSGMLLNTNAGSVLCVGYGSGESAATIALYQPEMLDCVEISPEVVEAATLFFGHLNSTEKPATPINIILMDGKNYLHLTDRAYDLILSDPINPRFADNASLYTAEYFESVSRHLNPQGLFLCWIPLNLPEEVFNSILATALHVFPHVTAWTVPVAGHSFVQIVCSPDRILFHCPYMDDRAADPRIGASLAGLGIESAISFLECYMGDEKDLRQYLQRHDINSDMRPFVEFSTHPIMKPHKRRALLSRLRHSRRRDSILSHLIPFPPPSVIPH